MTVALINPTIPTMGHWPPLGIAYLAAVLEKGGVRTEIIDRNIFAARKQDLDRSTVTKLLETKPDIVGITATTPLAGDAFRVADLVKANLPGVTVVLGGTHANVLPAETLEECPSVDAVCLGEGEDTMLEMASGTPPGRVAGLVFRDGERIVANPPRAGRADLDSIPLPARHLLDMSYYASEKVQVIRGLDMKGTHLFTARGCPFKCTFCAGSCVFGPGVRFHSPGYVFAEMEHLVDRYKVEGLYFAEDMFLANRTRAREICDGIVRRGLQTRLVWAAQVRPDVVDDETLAWMKKAGCVQLEFGFESGSQRVLDMIRKRTKVEENVRAALLAKRHGFRIVANMLVGIPGERREDLEATIAFIKAIRPEFVGFNRLIPLPGSEIFETLVREARMTKDWSRYHFGADNFASEELNFTEMRATEIEEIAGRFARTWLRRRHVWNYLSANLRRHPLKFVPRMASLAWENRQAALKMLLGSR